MLTLTKRHATPFYQLFISPSSQTSSNFLPAHMPFNDKPNRRGGGKGRIGFNNIKGRSLSAGLPRKRYTGPEPARTYPRRPGAGPARDHNNKDSL
ncbi:hypothetical protein CgunFtcFv8_026482 [Champsocephalus gunnari]|uniref:Uncharacterized protein n=1 Tax=Champsocephalus gunnari TaxID=52237 RepID=A0AAN8DW88_CHAGU|nr:hypothetical protein CgunFtcFv8_026482 [Champsocephalus gunnari]